ncbi:hypothetical protein DSO57_1011671 [Entomophthora muscae]|uniref:Uncharacterized protein n=1 Tax=Entomophthora muscae TaxID=34485 RepID=A0ACC2RX34_9FUNG|nr:hypothetical protein DSO57_1011671 [Entomophthora muscae]
MSQAHAAACFCFPVEHTISYLLENFGRAVSKLAVADTTAVKKTKILLADFRLTWSAKKTGVPSAMELTFFKTATVVSLTPLKLTPWYLTPLKLTPLNSTL